MTFPYECVAVCCSVLRCVAVCCSVLQCVAVCCSVLQYVAVCCNVLQCVAVCHAHHDDFSICVTRLMRMRDITHASEYTCVCLSEVHSLFRSLSLSRARVLSLCRMHPRAGARVQCVAVCCSVLHRESTISIPRVVQLAPRTTILQQTATHGNKLAPRTLALAVRNSLALSRAVSHALSLSLSRALSLSLSRALSLSPCRSLAPSPSPSTPPLSTALYSFLFLCFFYPSQNPLIHLSPFLAFSFSLFLSLPLAHACKQSLTLSLSRARALSLSCARALSFLARARALILSLALESCHI